MISYSAFELMRSEMMSGLKRIIILLDLQKLKRLIWMILMLLLMIQRSVGLFLELGFNKIKLGLSFYFKEIQKEIVGECINSFFCFCIRPKSSRISGADDELFFLYANAVTVIKVNIGIQIPKKVQDCFL